MHTYTHTTHAHTHTLLFHSRLQTFDPYSKHSEDPYRNPKVCKETSPGKMKGGVFQRPPVPSSHPPPLLCSRTLSGECALAMSIFTHSSLDWVVIPDIQELSGTLLTMVIVWIGWIVLDNLGYLATIRMLFQTPGMSW